MELAVVCIVLLACYFLFRFGSSSISWLTGGRFRAYRLLAERYHGRYESRGLYDPPTVSFFRQNSLVRVGLAPVPPGQRANPRTRVVARFTSGIPFRLELAPNVRQAPRQAPKGTRPVKLGISILDRDFSVRTNDTEMARDFLNPHVVSAICDLQAMVVPGGMLVSINPERLLVQVDRNLGLGVETLDRAVADALVLHDGLLVGVSRWVSAGINIVSNQAEPGNDEAPPTCKVCGEAIGEAPVIVCSACQTPHHRDCWEFVGGCSIYGCNCKIGTLE
ncbi:MAG: hypothetical protein ABS79_02665 [Planctomycetes bacterium SCN 63-9]|nr:MAG: hypothetical protein ABS79_02665 [Planctomycetes bacterium SCN 63-9]